MNQTEADKYTYRTMWSEEDAEFVGLCAEFPSLSWLDASPGAALNGIRQVVSGCISDMARNKEDIPLPISARRYSGKIVVQVG